MDEEAVSSRIGIIYGVILWVCAMGVPAEWLRNNHRDVDEPKDWIYSAHAPIREDGRVRKAWLVRTNGELRWIEQR